MNKKKVYIAEQKVRILREYPENNVSVSKLCEQYQIHPNNFFHWKKKLFEGAMDTFSPAQNQKKDRRITVLEQKLQDRDSLISTIVSENISLKNFNGEI